MSEKMEIDQQTSEEAPQIDVAVTVYKLTNGMIGVDTEGDPALDYVEFLLQNALNGLLAQRTASAVMHFMARAQKSQQESKIVVPQMSTKMQ